MDDDHLWLHVNDRGISRQVEELWIPHLRIDVVWLSDSLDDDICSTGDGRLVPVMRTSPAGLAALYAEHQNEDRRALAIVGSLSEVLEAAAFGLSPLKITIVALGDDNAERVAPGVWLSDDDYEALSELEEMGFSTDVQILPNVTGRPMRSAPAELRDTVGEFAN